MKIFPKQLAFSQNNTIPSWFLLTVLETLALIYQMNVPKNKKNLKKNKLCAVLYMVQFKLYHFHARIGMSNLTASLTSFECGFAVQRSCKVIKKKT